MARTRIAGLAAKQRALRALPQEAQKQFVKPLSDAGAKIAKAMQDKAPAKSGALRQGITFRVYETSLRLVVGLLAAAGWRPALFYGRIQDLGRKAQTVTVHRSRGGWATTINAGRAKLNAKTGKLVDSYPLKVKAMAGKHFVTGRYSDLRTELRQDLTKAYDQAVTTVADA